MKMMIRLFRIMKVCAAVLLAGCWEIAAFAGEQGIEINYSAQRSLLAEDFLEVFERAAINKSVFNGPRAVRVLALRGEHAYGWTEEEFKRIVDTASLASERAASHGVRFTVENADAALTGKGKGFYGMTELLAATGSDVLLQLDTANLFTGPEPVSLQEAEAFVRRYAGRISYLHLKSARDRKPLPVLDGNPLPFERIFALLETNGKPVYAAIELASGTAATDEIYQNMDASLTNLNKIIRKNK